MKVSQHKYLLMIRTQRLEKWCCIWRTATGISYSRGDSLLRCLKNLSRCESREEDAGFSMKSVTAVSGVLWKVELHFGLWKLCSRNDEMFVIISQYKLAFFKFVSEFIFHFIFSSLLFCLFFLRWVQTSLGLWKSAVP